MRRRLAPPVRRPGWRRHVRSRTRSFVRAWPPAPARYRAACPRAARHRVQPGSCCGRPASAAGCCRHRPRAGAPLRVRPWPPARRPRSRRRAHHRSCQAARGCGPEGLRDVARQPRLRILRVVGPVLSCACLRRWFKPGRGWRRARAAGVARLALSSLRREFGSIAARRRAGFGSLSAAPGGSGEPWARFALQPFCHSYRN